MSLFGLGKKKDENCCSKSGNGKNKNDSCTCSQNDGRNLEQNGNMEKTQNTIFDIKVLGSGCKNCHTLFVNTNEALKIMGVDCEAQYITDMSVVASYGIMSTPALVVNNKVVGMGKVYQVPEIVRLLHKLGY